MMTRARAAAMAKRLIPERGEAVVTLSPDYTPESVTVYNAWAKPVASSLKDYGHLNVQGDETLIHILDNELNQAGNGREIRARDKIVWDGETYRVTQSGATLKTIRTVWVCVCVKEPISA